VVTGGGIIPDEDVPYLREQGVDRVFGPGTPTSDIVAYMRTAVEGKR
jgi:methylmalonyl-CoA mutase C-terminal domain/subunit